MRTFNRVHERRTKVEEPLSIGQSAALITGLSVLAWGVVIFLVVALRAIV
jgi:hypothetical protein